MMPKHSLRAPRARHLTALLAVSLLTVGACSDDGGGSSKIAEVRIVTLPNNQAVSNLVPGTTRQMMAVPVNEKDDYVNKPVTWSGSNDAVGTISATGAFAAVSGGTVYLRASAGGRTDSIAVTVRFPVGTINVIPATVEIRREGSQQLTLEVLDTQGNPVTGRTIVWTKSADNFSTVNATGLVVGDETNEGTSVVTATCPNATDGPNGTAGTPVSGTRNVVVAGEPAVAVVVMAGGGGFMGNTQTPVQLTATPRSGADNVVAGVTLDWASSNEAVATVDATGLVTLVGGTTAGTANISASTPPFPGSTATITGAVSFEIARVLQNGVAFAVPNLAGGAGYSMAFDATGIANFTVVAAGGSGDADLYVIAPGVTNWTTTDNGGSNFVCRSWNSGNSENCPINPAADGWYRIRSYAWTPAGAANGVMVTLTHP